MRTRIDRDEWGLLMALTTSRRSTCSRRSVGCILVDEGGHVLATGYNGVAAGLPHCNEIITMMEVQGFEFVRSPNRCKGWDAPSGTNLAGCDAVHAEENALMQCADMRRIHTAYVTASPCRACVKKLLNTGCKRVVFIERYAHDAEALALWSQVRSAEDWVHRPLDNLM